jgi:inorganic pyrophosphatase
MKRQWKRDNKAAESTQLRVVIETPKGSRNKFKYDPGTQTFKLSKVMPEGMVFPYDFGFVPSTKAEDGDPLDVLVLTDESLFPGCSVDCRLIGVIEAEQEEEGEEHRNDRLIAAATQSLLYCSLRTLDDVAPIVLKQIEDFFVNYQRVRNVTVRIIGRKLPQQALELVRRASIQKHAA